MTKTELAAAMAEITGQSKKDSEKAINAFTNAVSHALKKGEKVQLIGFGTFETGIRAAKTGRNPHTGENISIPEKTITKFKAGKALKDMLNA